MRTAARRQRAGEAGEFVVGETIRLNGELSRHASFRLQSLRDLDLTGEATSLSFKLMEGKVNVSTACKGANGARTVR